jgi:hypothetical protein
VEGGENSGLWLYLVLYLVLLLFCFNILCCVVLCCFVLSSVVISSIKYIQSPLPYDRNEDSLEDEDEPNIRKKQTIVFSKKPSSDLMRFKDLKMSMDMGKSVDKDSPARTIRNIETEMFHIKLRYRMEGNPHKHSLTLHNQPLLSALSQVCSLL